MKASPLENIGAVLFMIGALLSFFSIAEIPAMIGMAIGALLYFIGFKQRKHQGGAVVAAQPTKQRFLLVAGALAAGAVAGPFLMRPSVLTFPPKIAIIFWSLNVVITGGLIAFFLWKAARAGKEKP